jgi:hypothetical protein
LLLEVLECVAFHCRFAVAHNRLPALKIV